MILRDRKTMVGRLLKLRQRIDDLAAPLAGDISRTKALDRIALMLEGWSASLGALLEDLNMECLHEELAERQKRMMLEPPFKAGEMLE